MAPQFSAGPPLIRHNLGSPCPSFVGRTDELEEIWRRLYPASRQYLIPIEAPGPYGKTALAREIAWRVVTDGAALGYTSVIWVDPPSGVADPNQEPAKPARGAAPTYLHHLLDTVAMVIGPPAPPASPLGSLDLRTGLRMLQRYLEKAGSVLLILDALNDLTAPDVDELQALKECLPHPSKAIATLRGGRRMGFPIHLGLLGAAEIAVLVADAAARLGIPLTPGEVARVTQQAYGCVGFALDLVGCMHGEGVGPVLATLTARCDAFAAASLGEVSHRLQREHPDSYALLRTIASNPYLDICAGATREEIANACGIPQSEGSGLFDPLLLWNLLIKSTIGAPDCPYVMLPATRAYFRT